MLQQRTLKSLTRAVGVGLHSGQRVELTLRPAPAGHRHRVPPRRPARAGGHPGVGRGRDRHAAGLHHLQRRRQGAHGRAPDVGLRRPGHGQPVHRHHGRGSADPRRLVVLLRVPAAKRGHRAAEGAAPLHPRARSRSRCAKARATTLKWARLEPYHGYKLSFEIDFDHRVVDSTGQRVEFDLGKGSYSRDIARARTFGFTKDVEMMRANGLALGGGLDNAIVMDDYRVLNTDGLRYDDEFVKHKILDAMGDLYLHRQAAAGRLQRVPLGPRAEQQAAARTAGPARRLRGRHLRRREAGARRVRAARARLVAGPRCCCSAGPSCCCCWRPACSFAFYAGTGQARYKRFGLVIAQVDADRGASASSPC